MNDIVLVDDSSTEACETGNDTITCKSHMESNVNQVEECGKVEHVVKEDDCCHCDEASNTHAKISATVISDSDDSDIECTLADLKAKTPTRTPGKTAKSKSSNDKKPITPGSSKRSASKKKTLTPVTKSAATPIDVLFANAARPSMKLSTSDNSYQDTDSEGKLSHRPLSAEEIANRAKAKEEERARKEAERLAAKEAKRLEKEAEIEKKRKEKEAEAEKKRLEREAELERKRKEKEAELEAKRLAKLAEQKAKEEEKRAKEEAARLEKERKAAEKAEQQRIAEEKKMEEKRVKEEEKRKKEEERLEKQRELERIRAEKEEAKRLAEEEKRKAEEREQALRNKQRQAFASFFKNPSGTSGSDEQTDSCQHESPEIVELLPNGESKVVVKGKPIRGDVIGIKVGYFQPFEPKPDMSLASILKREPLETDRFDAALQSQNHDLSIHALKLERGDKWKSRVSNNRRPRHAVDRDCAVLRVSVGRNGGITVTQRELAKSNDDNEAPVVPPAPQVVDLEASNTDVIDLAAEDAKSNNKNDNQTETYDTKTFSFDTISDLDNFLMEPTNSGSKKFSLKCKYIRIRHNCEEKSWMDYIGTWRKTLERPISRKPMTKLESFFDYNEEDDYYSDVEDPGESVSDSEGEDDDKKAANSEDEYEYDEEGFVVPHGYLSEEEGGDEECADTEKLKRRTKEWEARFKKKCVKLVPKITGPFWGPNKPPELMNLMPVFLVETTKPIPVLVPDDDEVLRSKDKARVKDENVITVIPKSAIPELIRLVHGNTRGVKPLVEEFKDLWNNKTKTLENPSGDNLSKKKLEIKILTIAEREKREQFNKVCWYVNEDSLKEHGLQDLPIPNSRCALPTEKVPRPVIEPSSASDPECNENTPDPNSSKCLEPPMKKMRVEANVLSANVAAN